jgi:DNA polymerase-3 subunit gamma/tau
MRGATSPRLMLELMCAQVLLPAPGTGEMAVLARLERLERRLGSGAGLAGSGGQVPPQPAGQTAAAAPGSAGRPPRPDSAGRPAGPDRAQTDVPKADVREDKAGNNGTSAQGVVPDAGRPAAGGTSPGTSGAKGKADTESIREQWAAVLDAVRLERRVAWLLLSNATVDSLADGVLTLRFGKEGEARGFAISGYDRDLGQVIQAMFGIAPQIRALAGPVQGPVAQARGTRGREGREPGAQGAGAQDAGSRDAGSQEAGSRDAGSHRAGSHGAGSQDAGSQDAGSHGRELPEAGSQGREPSGDGQPGRSAADSTRTGREATGGHEILSASAARSGGGTGTRRASPPSAASASRQSSGFGPGDQASDADIADMSDADALSGMDLVERELGGRIIEEIGEA